MFSRLKRSQRSRLRGRNSQSRRLAASAWNFRPRLESLEDRTLLAVLDAGFTDAAFVSASGVNVATGLAWAPDGSDRLYIARKPGNVRVIQNGVLLAADFSTDTVYQTSECGLIGIAFDRDYVTNGYVYLFMTVSSTEQQIVRYTDADKNNVADVGSRTVIVSGLATAGANHDGGAVGIGFDNKLYWGIGDNGNFTGVDLDLTSTAAKIGRANLDGTVPNDNPFNDGAGPNNDYIWSRGWRNPFTFTFQETTGQLWVNDVGTSYEQVFKVNAGDHAGYNDYEGNQPISAPNPNQYIQPEIVYRTNGTTSRTITANGAVRSGNIVTITTNSSSSAFLQPGNKITISGVSDSSFNGDFDILSVLSNTQFTYAQTGANATSGSGTAVTQAIGGAIVGGTFLNTTAVPAQYRGNFFFGDFNSDDIYRVTLDGSNNVTSVNPFITSFNGGFLDPVDSAVGPDGALYTVSAGGSNSVIRTAYTPTVQDLIVTPTYLAFPEGGRVGFAVRLAIAPAAPVTVNIARTSGDSDLSVFSGSTLTFTPSNYATPQAVILAAGGDADSVNDSATFSISSAGLTTQTLGYTAIDAGGQNLVLSTTSLNVNEGGTTTFTVRLQSPPAGNVNVNVARTSGDSDINVTGGATLTFTPSNYATPQTVTLAAAEDADNVNDTTTISITALSATTRTVSVTGVDNDSQAPSITTTAKTTAVVGALYSYDVDATGSPTPGYSLAPGFPTGMTINTTTGVISWTPSVTGTFPVTVRAANGVAPDATQSFSITVSADAPPTATLTQPVNGATISGTNAEFFGDGSDDVGTVRAEFYVDGVLRYTDINTGGHYHFGGTHLLFDTTQYSNGPHTLRMTVVDTAGQSGFAEVNVTISNGPEIDVRGNGVSIADGDTTPSAADHTVFGSAPVSGGSVTRTFTIANTGPGTLNLTGTPRVAVSGSHAADFTVSVQPNSPVAASSGTTTFSVVFDPTAVGQRTATLTIASNDADEGTYDFVIQGTGTNSSPTASGISTVNVTEDAANTVLDLTNSFNDAEDGAAGLTYTIAGNTNSGLFSSTSVSTGLLTLDFADNQQGTANITIRATDSSGASVTSTFTVNIAAVNDAPLFNIAGNPPRTDENAGAKTVANFATGMAAGPATATDETTQTLTFNVSVTGTTGTLTFASLPTINSATGTLSYTPTANTSGTATVQARLVDSGNGSAPNVNTSGVQTFTIMVNALNWHNRTDPSNVDQTGTTNGLDLQFVVEAMNVVGSVYLPDLAQPLPTPGILVDVDGNNTLNGLDLQTIVSVMNTSMLRSLAKPSGDSTAATDSLDSLVAQGLAATYSPRVSELTPTVFFANTPSNQSLVMADRVSNAAENQAASDAAFAEYDDLDDESDGESTPDSVAATLES